MSIKEAKIEELLGTTLTSAEGEKGGDQITFKLDDGRIFVMLHQQDCCESVRVEDICGDLSDLVGSPILLAEEVSSNEPVAGIAQPEETDDSFTWTFYKLATVKGAVTIRWYGTSNGYYSEHVDCEWREEDDND